MATALLDKMPNGEPNRRNPDNAQAKSKEFLRLNELKGGDGQTKPFSEYSEQEMYKELKTRLEQLEELLQENHGHSLHHGREPHSPADASLFGVLLQFFETPLNDPQIRSLFPEEGVLHKFVQNAKRTLRLEELGWKKLTQRPWAQNFDTDYIFAFSAHEDKYIGPYKLSVGDLNPKNFYNRINYEDGRVRFELAKDEKESLPGEIVRAAKRLARIANRNKRGLSPYDYAQAMLSVMAAYVCDVGNWGAKALLNSIWHGIKALKAVLLGQEEKKCTEQHMDRAREMFNQLLNIREAKQIDEEIARVRTEVFRTIVEHNDAKTRANVVRAIREVQGVAAQGQEQAARVTSSPQLTNEL